MLPLLWRPSTGVSALYAVDYSYRQDSGFLCLVPSSLRPLQQLNSL
jgi:hypothetical protein